MLYRWRVVHVRVDAVRNALDLVARSNDSLAVQKTRGEFEIVAGRAHRDRNRLGCAARDDANLERLFGHDGVVARRSMRALVGDDARFDGSSGPGVCLARNHCGCRNAA